MISKSLNRFIVTLGALTLATVGIHAAQAAPAPKTSTGVTCTIVGTSGNNVITGTSGKDVICGLGGNDTIKGLGGNDIIDGGAGNDAIYGGDGNDTLIAGAGNDRLNGDAGNDVENGGDGNDILSGGTGNDTENGDAGNDSEAGGDGNDKLSGGAGNDSFSGDAGNDTEYGGDGNDTENGGSGNDTLWGDAGDDKEFGDSGNDSEAGGAGSDSEYGGDGNDAISGGDGNDKLYGDAGADALKGQGGDDGMIGGTGADDLSGADGAPAPAERNLCEKDASDVVTHCGFDEAAPWIVSAEVNKTSVDASTSDQVVQATLHVTDELMGVAAVGCSITLEGARTSTGYQQAVRISGDAIDGTYVCNVTIPAGGSAGRWGLDFDTRDRTGNMGLAYQVTDGKWHSNLPEIMDQSPSHWIEQTGVGDQQAPRITNPAFSKTTIDTSGGTDSFNLDFTLTDDFSGVNQVTCHPIHNAVDSADITVRVTKLSGDNKNGVWRCAITLPKNSGHGRWTVVISAVDNTSKRYSVTGVPGSDTLWEVDDTAVMNSQPPLELGMNYITQTGAGDDELPTMTSISLDKTQVNTASADQTVVATLNLLDVQSGVKSVDLRTVSPTTFAWNIGSCAFTSKDGAGHEVWTCSIKLPLGSQKGLHAFSIMMFDNAGNRVTYTYNPDTGKWSMRPLNFTHTWISTENLDLGPVGILNTDQ